MHRRSLASIPVARPRHERGLTLIELMIALSIGLLIVAAMSVLLAGSSWSRREVELSADVNENGRYAIDVLNRELSQTGFYGSLVQPTAASVSKAIDTPATAVAAMCSTTLGDWEDWLSYYVLGLRSVGEANVAGDDASCVARKAGTDALFVQRASTCVIGLDCQN